MHGCDVSQLDHEQFCALWFTRRENEVRAASIDRLAITSSQSELPLSWFIATRDTIEEAHAAHDRHVAAMASLGDR